VGNAFAASSSWEVAKPDSQAVVVDLILVGGDKEVQPKLANASKITAKVDLICKPVRIHHAVYIKQF
jgi:hypothetical protein